MYGEHRPDDIVIIVTADSIIVRVKFSEYAYVSVFRETIRGEKKPPTLLKLFGNDDTRFACIYDVTRVRTSRMYFARAITGETRSPFVIQYASSDTSE